MEAKPDPGRWLAVVRHICVALRRHCIKWERIPAPLWTAARHSKIVYTYGSFLSSGSAIDLHRSVLQPVPTPFNWPSRCSAWGQRWDNHVTSHLHMSVAVLSSSSQQKQNTRTGGTSQDKITAKVSHSHEAHGGCKEPEVVSKMAVYHFRSQQSAFRRQKFERSDFFPLKRKNRLSRMGGQSRRIYLRVSGIRLKGDWTSGLARVKIARILIARAENWSRMPIVRWPLAVGHAIPLCKVLPGTSVV